MSKSVAFDLQADRFSDALLIASLQGPGSDLWLRTRKAYMARVPRPYMPVVAAIGDGDFAGARGPANTPMTHVYRYTGFQNSLFNSVGITVLGKRRLGNLRLLVNRHTCNA